MKYATKGAMGKLRLHFTMRTKVEIRLKEIFLKHYCPRAAIDKITEELLQLRQTNEYVDEINGIFFDKARFCPALLTTPELWMTRYHLILKTEIREFIHSSKCANSEEMIDWERGRETELKRREQEERRGLSISYAFEEN
ncbi:hypothetical protein L1987_23130 [Smallanthus sonchifolius]|uniref:Uncharacterized protein n=1 Tax=Smallanthus sonchifolius TaxID=185202 RepID=A0ACB9II93_9ASTR|nr:hypothetical protein L1987_23130 [Smallanthus sonchifolius]